MMDILKDIVLHHKGDDQKFNDALERLLCSLLIKTGDYHSKRPTDGILLQFKQFDHSILKIAGTAVMIADQSAEPIRGKFIIKDEKITEVSIYFGLQPSSQFKNSSKLHAINNKILANPDIDFEWKYLLTFDGIVWGIENL